MFREIKVIIFLVFATTIFSCKTPSSNDVDIGFFKTYAEQYLKELPEESRQLQIPETGEIKIKVYIKEVNPKNYTIHGRVETVSGNNIPSDFDKICLDGECFDVFLFLENQKTRKNISVFLNEFQQFSEWYPYLSNHLPVWELDISQNKLTKPKHRIVRTD